MKKLFKVNNDYVVADCYEDAIKIWLRFYGTTYTEEDNVKSVELVNNEVIVEE